MDYRALLTKYIAYVGMREGTDFICGNPTPHDDWGQSGDFAQAEWDELLILAGYRLPQNPAHAARVIAERAGLEVDHEQIERWAKYADDPPA